MTEKEHPEPQKPKPVWRVLKWLAIGLTGLVILLLITAVGLRLYYNDERIRTLLQTTLSEKTQTAVTIGALDLKLLSGLEIKNAKVGPPAGFADPPVEVGRFEARYTPSALLAGRVEITVVRVENVSLTFEEKADGSSNVNAILQAMFPPAETKPDDNTPPPAAEPALPELPALPVDVVVKAVRVGPVDVTVKRPDSTLRLDKIYAQAQADIVDDAYRALLWAGLGERDTPESRSTVELRQGEALSLNGNQRLSVELDFGGFDDISVSVRFDGETDPAAPVDTPPIRSALSMDVTADLFQQRAELSAAELKVGEGTRLTLTAVGSKLLGDRTVDLGAVELTSDLDELEPLARAVNPALSLGGRVQLTTTPMRITDSPPADASAELRAESVRAGFGPHRASGLNSELALKLSDGAATAEGRVSIAAATSGVNRVQAARLEFAAETALTPWITDGDGDLSARATLSAESASVPGVTLAGMKTEASAEGPVELVKVGRSGRPMNFSITQTVSSVALAGQRIRGVRLETSGSLNDLRGEAVNARAKARIARIDSQVGDATVRIPPVAASLIASRNGQRVSARELELSVGALFDLEGEFAAERAFTPTPRIRSARLYLAPFDLKQAVEVLPPSLRPNQRFGGMMSFDAELSGDLPIRTLTAAAQPPAGLEDLGPFLERLARLFERGLPFTGHIGFETNDVYYEDLSTFAKGISVDLDLNILESGPKLEVALLLDTLEQPASLGGVALNSSIAFSRRTLESDTFLRVGRYEGPSLPKPLRDATLEWKSTYTVGGAFAVEKLAALAPDRDGRLIGTFLMQTPLRVLRERGWEQPGMPGVDINAELEGGLRISDDAPLTVPGIDVDGGFGFASVLRVKDGIIDSEGVVTAQRLSLENETVVVSEVDGGVPFQVSLATQPKDGYVTLPQRVLFGDGRVRVGIGQQVKVASRRPLYFPRIRRYRADRGVRIRSVYARGFEVEYLELSGALRNGGVVAERARLSLLGGDIEGSLSMGLSGDRSVSGSMEVKVSNLDASYFPALKLKPGKDSEVDADATLGFVVSPSRRDLTANMNVTKISAKGFDRLLQLLDPVEENPAIQSTRFYLNLAQINGVAMWLAYENLNMDLDANSIIKIPFTDVGVPNFERELLRRMSMSDFLDVYWDPLARRTFSPLIGGLGAR